MKVAPADLAIVKILSKTLDIRDQNQFYFKVSLLVNVASSSYPNNQNFIPYKEYKEALKKNSG